MSANVEGMVREGVSAFKAGRVDEARALLSKAVELDPYNEQGWLWLSGAVSSAEDQRTCLENVLAINPTNARARSGLDFLVRQAAPPEATALPPTPPAPAPAAAAPEPPPAAMPALFSADVSSPSSVEWSGYDAEAEDDWSNLPAEPASSYDDDWVSGLQLGGTDRQTRPADDPFASVSTSSSTSPFFAGSDIGADEQDAAAFDTSASFMLSPADETPAPPAPVRLPLPYAAKDDRDERPLAHPLGAVYSSEIEIDDDELLIPDDGGEVFAEIPREIKATRLPGVQERGPLGLKLIAVLLIPLNLAAALLLFWKLL